MAARPLPPPLSVLRSTINDPSKPNLFHFSFRSTHPIQRLPTKSISPLRSHPPPSFPFPLYQQKPRNNGDEEQQVEAEFQPPDDDERMIGDCLVFEEGAFEGSGVDEDDFLRPTSSKTRPRNTTAHAKSDSLVPEKWKEAVAEINLTKKEKRVIARELRSGSKVERKTAWKKPPGFDLEEYLSYRRMKLSQLRPLVLDDPVDIPTPPSSPGGEGSNLNSTGRTCGRVTPKNPRSEVAGVGVDAINDFFNSGNYVPEEDFDDKKPKGSRKLFTKEEKILLNRRIPSLTEATSRKWLPLHALAASGEFYLLDSLLKHNVDINAADMNGLSAIHKAILGKKQAILNYLLRESANPFVLDNDGATLIHYAVRTAFSPAIKILILYNVDINRSDNDGWTPLHLAVQTQRTDIVKLLLIKGADKTLKNKDGLTPLDLCLYSGRSARTFELIKLLKELPRSKVS